MKRALAMLAAAIFSIVAGVEYILPQQDYFALNTTEHQYYYSINESSISAADLYRMQYGTNDRSPACKTENFTPHRTQANWGDNRPYWFAIQKPSDDTAVSDGDVSGTFSKSAFNALSPESDLLNTVWTASDASGDYYICAPTEGYIRTSHYACDYGAEMDFEFEIGNVKYIMQIRNAKCWYCCRDKQVSSDGNSGAQMQKDKDGNERPYYQANTRDSLKDRYMSAGNLLVVATAKTTVTIVKNG